MDQIENNVELEIILVLIRGKSHLREISRAINKPHSTVLRKINELIERNVLDYKIEGKNKVFFIKKNLQSRNYVYLSEIHKLNKLIKKYSELSIIIEDILRDSPEKLVILFGSYAKDNPKERSDIDIYIDTEDKKIKNKIEGLNSKLSLKIGRFDKNSLLIKEIIKNHVILRGWEEFYERIGFFK